METSDSVVAVELPLDWAEENFGQANLGDRRRTRRTVTFAVQVAAHPAGGIPHRTRRWGDTKAAYRLLSQEDVTLEALQEPHWGKTRQAAGMRPVVLRLHDGSQLEDVSRVKALPGTVGVVAARLLQLKQYARLDPDKAAEECVSRAHVRMLAAYWAIAAEGMMVRVFWRRVAQLGGSCAARGTASPAGRPCGEISSSRTR